MLSPPLLPPSHNLSTRIQITDTSNQFTIMRELHDHISCSEDPSLFHPVNARPGYQKWKNESFPRTNDPSPYMGKFMSPYILGSPTGPEIARKPCPSQAQFPITISPSFVATPPVSASTLCHHQRNFQPEYPPHSACSLNARVYGITSTIETPELSIWSMKNHRYQPYSNQIPMRHVLPNTQGATYLPHLLPSTPQQPGPFAHMSQCGFGSEYPPETAMHRATWLTIGDRLNNSPSLTRRCARCRCPNCVSPNAVRGAKGKKEHICHFPNCGKVYGKTSHLKAHIRWHLGERPFICTWLFCGKSFTRSDELQRHIRTHTGEKKFQCQICEKKFMRSDHLSKHVKIHKKKALGSTSSEEEKEQQNTSDKCADDSIKEAVTV